jgi:hypothetical protein
MYDTVAFGQPKMNRNHFNELAWLYGHVGVARIISLTDSTFVSL